jgi:hypothetical protein
MNEPLPGKSRIMFGRTLLALCLALLASCEFWDKAWEKSREGFAHDDRARSSELKDTSLAPFPPRLTFAGAIEIYNRVVRSCWITHSSPPGKAIWGCDIQTWRDIENQRLKDRPESGGVDGAKPDPKKIFIFTKEDIDQIVDEAATTPPDCTPSVRIGCKTYHTDDPVEQWIGLNLHAAWVSFKIIWGGGWWLLIPFVIATYATRIRKDDSINGIAVPFGLAGVTFLVLLLGEVYFRVAELFGWLWAAVASLAPIVVLALMLVHTFKSWGEFKHELFEFISLKRRPPETPPVSHRQATEPHAPMDGEQGSRARAK